MRKTVVFEVLRGQRPLGAFLERLGLMDASWSGLGALLERSWTALGPKKLTLNGSWPLQEEFQERFQPS